MKKGGNFARAVVSPHIKVVLSFTFYLFIFKFCAKGDI